MLLFIWKILKRNVAVYMEKQLLITLILMSKTGNLKEHLYFYNWYKSCLLFYSWCILWYIGSIGYRVKRLSILTWTVNCKFIFWKDSDVKKTFCWWELFVYSFHLLWFIYIYWNFYRHIFNSIFLLTWHFSIFQIIFCNWKHVISQNKYKKELFCQVMKKHYLRNVLCKKHVEERLARSQKRFVRSQKHLEERNERTFTYADFGHL